VAKVNQVKLRQDADAAERAGKFDKAIEALKLIVGENPRDWNTVNRIGDLYAKLNNTRAANEQYVKVARYFADDGFYLKAIAVWKKVLRNDAQMFDGQISLGELYAKQGLVAEAKQTYAYVYDEYVKRNKLRDAGEVLRRMAEVDPADLKVRIRLAELYAREGDPGKAAGEYLTIADELVKKGLLSEALQLLEKALRGGPRSPKLLSAAARVYTVQKDYGRAVELLREAARATPDDREVALRLAEASLGAKRPDDARAALEALLARDPNDQEARQQLGSVYLAEGRWDEAYDRMAPAVDALVERRQSDRAAALLQQIVQRNPGHIRSLSKLVELYRQAQNEALVVQTYSQLVEAYLAGKEWEQAASILETLVQLEPHNEQHKSKLKWAREQVAFDVDLTRPQAPAPIAPAPAPAPPSTARGLELARRLSSGLELSGPLTPEDQEFISEHLAEGKVFRKYGLGDKARDQFEAILSRYPDNVEALRELADLHRERGENEAAAQRLRMLQEVHRLKGDSALAASAGEEADALAPKPAAKPAARPAPAPQPAPRAQPTAAPAAPAAAARAQPASPAFDLGIDIDVEEHDEPAPEEELDYVDLEAVPSEPERPSPTFDLSDLGPGDEIGSHFVDEEEPAPSPLQVEEDNPLQGDSGFDLGEPAEPAFAPPPVAPLRSRPAAPTFARPQPAPPPTFAPPLAPLRPKPAPPTMAPVRGVPAELQRALDEIVQYVSVGFVEDAKGVLEEMNARFPGHPALAQIVSELGLEDAGPEAPLSLSDDLGLMPGAPSAAAEEPLQLGGDLFGLSAPPVAPAIPAAPAPRSFADALADLAAPEPEPPPEPPPPEPAFDLSAELGDLFGAQPAVAEEPAPAVGTDLGDQALSDIFREFQKGVEKQLGKEDYETRYNLGIAYKEMGLVDEAIAEFQLAAKDEKRLLECASMLGICFLEKGMPKLAVKWFEKGLAAPGRSDEEYQGLRYDLANALEQAGDRAKALSVFTELYGQDASFRDVAEKVRRLKER
jgi:pilus assembly protein FimV